MKHVRVDIEQLNVGITVNNDIFTHIYTQIYIYIYIYIYINDVTNGVFI